MQFRITSLSFCLLSLVSACESGPSSKFVMPLAPDAGLWADASTDAYIDLESDSQVPDMGSDSQVPDESFLPDESSYWASAGGPRIISGGGNYTCGIRLDRTLRCWGSFGDDEDQILPPSGHFYEIACGPSGCSALRTDGSVVIFGRGQYELPLPARAIRIRGEANRACIVLETGEGRCWSVRSTPLLDEHFIGSSNRVAIDLVDPAPGVKFQDLHSGGCGLTADGGSLVYWPTAERIAAGTDEGVSDGPEGRFKAIVTCEGKAGMVLNSEDKLISFIAQTAMPHADLHGEYSQVENAGAFICGIEKEERTLDCVGTYFNIQPPMDATFLFVAAEFDAGFGGPRMYGITTTKTMMLWGNGGGGAMQVPDDFPFK